ncbi:ribbon-helix-helix protein, CopG family [Magnetospirillum sulfuroxidans]|uniref:CopG family transcriptional regulator n=1 Tax=Magnetospirillum sulfuroxidans TaxID=611300 RepID=A0ABS5IE39_9PROT|nr:ribbon-helix-helix protein, CopG family [Magnetospirillum sulfuroxidans]MBR9972689.1 CopG family transcriptional regulator [Magnetospirillum sulfuroxidans]
MNDEVMLTIRLPRSLRDEFQAMVKAQDMTASQVLRGAIRQYVKAGGGTAIVSPPVIHPRTLPVAAPPQSQPYDIEDPPVEKRAFAGIRAMLQMDDD